MVRRRGPVKGDSNGGLNDTDSAVAYEAKKQEVAERNRAMLQRQCWDASDAPERHKLAKVHRDNLAWAMGLEKAYGAMFGAGILALIGARGTGKTQIGVECIRKAAKHTRRALYTRCADIFIAVREAYQREAKVKEGDVLRYYARPWLLVIDEMNERAESPAEQRLLALLIDKRYAQLTPTILIGNLSADPDDALSLRRNVGESVYDRLIETGGFIECNWNSFRTEGK